MSKSTEQWKAIFQARNERRKNYDSAERKQNREMGRYLSVKMWDKSTNSPKMPAEPKKVIDR